MQFLKNKFFDEKGHIQHFLSGHNQLLKLEEPGRVSEKIKIDFVEQFIKKIVENGVIQQSTIDAVRKSYPKNSWSIDFPSWTGSFDEKKGKKVMIIGSEPHIHWEFLQTIYGFHNEKQAKDYIESDHPIFKYLSDVLAQKFDMSREAVLNECYLTDLFPLSPFRGEGVPLGSPEKIQAVLGDGGNWINIRSKYAKSSLTDEIAGVKPELIITQGVAVFLEVLNILGIINGLSVIPIFSSSGKKRQYVRKVEWNGIPIISVPHIGSGRMRTFWNNNVDAVKKAVAEI